MKKLQFLLKKHFLLLDSQAYEIAFKNRLNLGLPIFETSLFEFIELDREFNFMYRGTGTPLLTEPFTVKPVKYTPFSMRYWDYVTGVTP